MRAVHVFVSGRVQGVGFRAFTHSAGQRAGVKGWVRNTADGRVELVAQGDAAAVERLLHQVRQGPTFARVDEVMVEEVPVREDLPDFTVR